MSAPSLASGLVKESFYVFNVLEDMVIKNIEDLPRLNEEIEKLLRLMSPSDISMFYIFLLRFFDRIFGEEATGFREETVNSSSNNQNTMSTNILNTSSVSAPGNIATRTWVRGRKGGWLAIADGNMNHNTSLLINLISPTSKLMHLLLFRDPTISSQRKAYEMNLHVLPLKMQMKYMRSPFNECTSVLLSCYNYESKFKLVKSTNVSTVNPSKVDSFVVFMDPLEYFIVCLLKYPLTVQGDRRVGTSSNAGRDCGSSQQPQRAGLASIKALFDSGAAQWAKRNTYIALLHSYLELLFPVLPATSSIPASGLPLPAATSGAAAGGEQSLPEGSELFLALAVDFWLDNSRVIKRNMPLAESLKSRGSAAANASAGGASGGSLYRSSGRQPQPTAPALQYPSPLETVLIDSSESGNWTQLSLQSVFFLLYRLLQSRGLSDQFDDLQQSHARSKLSPAPGRTPPGSKRVEAVVLTGIIPQAVHIMQAPLFENLKLLFSRGDVIETSKFYMSAKIWLLYMQPWKAQRDANSYTPKWRSYVVANFHFYTTLLTLFLRAISRLDFSSSASSQQSNDFILLDLLHSVLGVFKGELNELLDGVLTGVFACLRGASTTAAITPNNKSSQLLSGTGTPTNHESGELTEAEVEAAVTHHFDMFPDLAVIACADAGLVSVRYHARDACKVIVESLYIHSEPQDQSFVGRAYNFFFGEQTWSEAAVKNAADIVYMITEVLCIVDSTTLSLNRTKMKKYAQIDLLDADRSPVGHRLTALGRQQIVEGRKKCTATFVDYRGDQMERPLTSVEWRHGARLLVRLSQHLNSRLQLPRDSASPRLTWRDVYFHCRRDIWSAHKVLTAIFRLNLRVLADVRVSYVAICYAIRLLQYYHCLSLWRSLLVIVALFIVSYLKFYSYFLVE